MTTNGPAGVGSAAPAGSAGKQLGVAAPAGNGTPAGTPSSPPKTDDAIVAAKKQAEHWQHKYSRDLEPVKAENADLKERLSRLEGIAQGAGLGSPKPPVESFADLDEDGLEKVIERGMADSNPGLVKATMKEFARREAAKQSKAAVAESTEHLQRVLQRNQVSAKVANEFGAPALDENSDLSQRAYSHIARLAGNDKNAVDRQPELIYLGYVLAQRDLTSGDAAELGRLREAEASRLRAEEAESQRRVIATKVRDEDKELIGQGNLHEVLRRRIGGVLNAKK